VAVFVAVPASASADSPQTVTTTANAGAGSLRRAITFANANPGTTINFAIAGSTSQLLLKLNRYGR
jgi:hypothetical protein